MLLPMAAMPVELEVLCQKLPPEKVAELVDFARFLYSKESGGDAAWEQIIQDARARPKLDAFVSESKEEGPVETLDIDKL
jgi:hypothetical protein